ncbi:hypothetical protein GOBAR_AA15599 [Gossypium barbadense]|uniref:Uncharacterized protein n=1 Tax=Gossypium barbadense TaxID=3634 RepID=A0A2P5XNZ3_GOSBA|nr:hypothetical protein GOBAR_AA15599 [Gossypium barbadense]
MSLKEAHELFSSSSRGPIHEDQRLQIEELDEWRTHKSRTPDKLNLRQNELNTFPNQLKVGDRVLLDAVDPHIVATTLNEEMPLTVLNIFPFCTVEVSHPKFSTFKIFHRDTANHTGMLKAVYHVIFTRKENRVPASKERKGASSSTGPTVEISHPLLQFPHGPQESTGVVNTHDAYFLWCMSHGHVDDLTYFIALAIQHQTERHRKGVISISPYVARLARHFRLLNTAAQESSLTLIGQMSLQGIPSMLSMRMIEKHRRTYPPQYHLAQSTEEEAYEDIPDDVPPQHEDPSTQPPPPSHPIHTAASYADISERLTQFE